MCQHETAVKTLSILKEEAYALAEESMHVNERIIPSPQVGPKQAVVAMNHIKRLQWQSLKDAAIHVRMKVRACQRQSR